VTGVPDGPLLTRRFHQGSVLRIAGVLHLGGGHGDRSRGDDFVDVQLQLSAGDRRRTVVVVAGRRSWRRGAAQDADEVAGVGGLVAADFKCFA
jgi:hypothetical protein